jgi:LTXXQ motif family protein
MRATRFAMYIRVTRTFSLKVIGRREVASSRDAAGKDRRDLTKFCDERSPEATDLPIDRIGQAVQPTSVQRPAFDELKGASVKAAEGLKVSCPSYQTLTPTGRVEAMEKRLDATLGAVKTVGPALVKFYNSLSDEQKARFNSLRSASRPAGWGTIVHRVVYGEAFFPSDVFARADEVIE